MYIRLTFNFQTVLDPLDGHVSDSAVMQVKIAVLTFLEKKNVKHKIQTQLNYNFTKYRSKVFVHSTCILHHNEKRKEKECFNLGFIFQIY